MFGSLDSLTKISTARSRSISAENVYGEPGRGGMAEVSDTPQPEVVRIGQGWGNNSCARELGQKWKVRPCITLAPAAVTTLMDVDGPGCIRHIWITVNEKHLRNIVLRMYWDGEEAPSVEVPLGDFFCNACLHTAQIVAVPINVNPTNGMNCYFPMPFARHAKITVENLLPDEGIDGFFYTINFEELDEPAGDAYFHARFNRTNPLRYGDDYTILDGVEGSGNFVGCYMTWQQNNNGWWGEGEVKMFLDGDTEFPTICGTGTEDYFGGAWCFNKTFSSPFLGYPFGGENRTGARHSLYRFHVLDAIHFHSSLKVTIQAIGWRDKGRYLPLQDDIASVAYWYQTEPHCLFPALPEIEKLEVN